MSTEGREKGCIASRLMEKGKGPGNCMMVSKTIMQKYGRNFAVALAALTDHHDMKVRIGSIPAGHFFYVTWSDLYESTGMRRNVLKKYQKEMVDLGIVEVREGADKSLRYYKLNIDAIMKAASKVVKKDHPQSNLDFQPGQKEPAPWTEMTSPMDKNDQGGRSKKTTPYIKDSYKDCDSKTWKEDGAKTPSASRAPGNQKIEDEDQPGSVTTRPGSGGAVWLEDIPAHLRPAA